MNPQVTGFQFYIDTDTMQGDGNPSNPIRTRAQELATSPITSPPTEAAPGALAVDTNTVPNMAYVFTGPTATDWQPLSPSTVTWLELSSLARYCESKGNAMASGAGSFCNGADLVPTRDGIYIQGIKGYIPLGLGLVGHSLRFSLWDTETHARITYADYVVQAGDEGTCVSVMFAASQALTAWHNVTISVIDMDGAPVYWLNTNANIQLSIAGTQPRTYSQVADAGSGAAVAGGAVFPANHYNLGSLHQVAISNGLWRCGSYYVAGDNDPTTGTYTVPPDLQATTIDPIIA